MLKDLALANDSKDNVTCLIIHAVAQRGHWHRRPQRGGTGARTLGAGLPRLRAAEQRCLPPASYGD